MKAKRFYFRPALLGILAVGLGGCSSPPCEKYLMYPPHDDSDRLITIPKPINPIQERNYDLCLLKKHGVQVIHLGETWKLVFPSDALFDNDTAEIRHRYEPVLNVAADFMRTYSKIAVKVTSYTDQSEQEMMTKFGTVSDELTTRQANAVVKYLTSHHIDARLIYGLGRGVHDPIAWNGTPEGRGFNRRVEVTFRYYKNNTAWY
jgi:outer membrane protein OmpA-like peptidoglycan-associated protein